MSSNPTRIDPIDETAADTEAPLSSIYETQHGISPVVSMFDQVSTSPVTPFNFNGISGDESNHKIDNENNLNGCADNNYESDQREEVNIFQNIDCHEDYDVENEDFVKKTIKLSSKSGDETDLKSTSHVETGSKESDEMGDKLLHEHKYSKEFDSEELDERSSKSRSEETEMLKFDSQHKSRFRISTLKQGNDGYTNVQTKSYEGEAPYEELKILKVDPKSTNRGSKYATTGPDVVLDISSTENEGLNSRYSVDNDNDMISEKMKMSDNSKSNFSVNEFRETESPKLPYEYRIKMSDEGSDLVGAANSGLNTESTAHVTRNEESEIFERELVNGACQVNSEEPTHSSNKNASEAMGRNDINDEVNNDLDVVYIRDSNNKFINGLNDKNMGSEKSYVEDDGNGVNIVNRSASKSSKKEEYSENYDIYNEDDSSEKSLNLNKSFANKFHLEGSKDKGEANRYDDVDGSGISLNKKQKQPEQSSSSYIEDIEEEDDLEGLNEKDQSVLFVTQESKLPPFNSKFECENASDPFYNATVPESNSLVSDVKTSRNRIFGKTGSSVKAIRKFDYETIKKLTEIYNIVTTPSEKFNFRLTKSAVMEKEFCLYLKRTETPEEKEAREKQEKLHEKEKGRKLKEEKEKMKDLKRRSEKNKMKLIFNRELLFKSDSSVDEENLRMHHNNRRGTSKFFKPFEGDMPDTFGRAPAVNPSKNRVTKRIYEVLDDDENWDKNLNREKRIRREIAPYEEIDDIVVKRHVNRDMFNSDTDKTFVSLDPFPYKNDFLDNVTENSIFKPDNAALMQRKTSHIHQNVELDTFDNHQRPPMYKRVIDRREMPYGNKIGAKYFDRDDTPITFADIPTVAEKNPHNVRVTTTEKKFSENKASKRSLSPEQKAKLAESKATAGHNVETNLVRQKENEKDAMKENVLKVNNKGNVYKDSAEVKKNNEAEKPSFNNPKKRFTNKNLRKTFDIDLSNYDIPINKRVIRVDSSMQSKYLRSSKRDVYNTFIENTGTKLYKLQSKHDGFVWN